MNEPVPLISIRQLHKSFPAGSQEIHVLRGLDLEVYAGEMLGIVGVSGVGKSTLLQILGGLESPTSGAVTYGEVDLFRLGNGAKAAFRDRKIGFVFQFHYLRPEFTALENVMMPLLIGREPPALAAATARKLLAEVGLEERLEHKPAELSGGEQQRVAMARALVTDPDVVLADEPTGNLDGPTGRAIHHLLREINRQRGTTFVIVTHNEELAGLMDRVVRLSDGRIQAVRGLPGAVSTPVGQEKS
ncbi:MAG: ABC transporter ATP-binding protein [Candidatus Tectomicrobia bacterium]|uniref:ABC transporter ATP-binding protein n=1 Tax=Tectimicrobiota bacterium TaxID=2528274 RepID=A0A932M1S4_UNCTE|nr:ABC transporter ATP-binding protein [Candidatus Tectomicrobia bacterium]